MSISFPSPSGYRPNANGSDRGKLYALNPNGTLKWAFTTGSTVRSSPALGLAGTVYVGSDDHKLYAVYGDSPGLAGSSWPMFHHDLRHRGNLMPNVPRIPGINLILGN